MLGSLGCSIELLVVKAQTLLRLLSTMINILGGIVDRVLDQWDLPLNLS